MAYFVTTSTKKIKDVPATVAMSIPELSSITINVLIGQTYEKMAEYTANETIEISGSGLNIQVVPTGTAGYEIF